MHDEKVHDEDENVAKRFGDERIKLDAQSYRKILMEHVARGVDGRGDTKQDDGRERSFRADIKFGEYQNIDDNRIKTVGDEQETARGERV